jgi:hypothetical protein
MQNLRTFYRRIAMWAVLMWTNNKSKTLLRTIFTNIHAITLYYIQINTWAFPYWPGYHPETPILARDGVEG